MWHVLGLPIICMQWQIIDEGYIHTGIAAAHSPPWYIQALLVHILHHGIYIMKEHPSKLKDKFRQTEDR